MTGRSRAPGSAVAASLRLEDLAVDPYPHLAELRSQGAAVWAPNLGMWVLAGYDDTVAVLRDPERFTNDSPKSLIQATFGRQMLSVEGEEQKRHKQACLAPFTGKASREVWQPRVDRLCGGLLDAAERAAAGGAAEVDLMADYAAPIALKAMEAPSGYPRRAPIRLAGLLDRALAQVSSSSANPRSLDTDRSFERSDVRESEL